MPTNLQINGELLKEAQAIGGFKTKRETVDKALQAYVEHHKQLAMLELEGGIEYYEDYDYKELRKDR